MKTDNEKPKPGTDTLFSALVWRLSMETRAFLGEQMHPELDTIEPRLDYAAYSIDTIQMLKERTEGRRSTAETEMLDDILCQLRIDYLATRRRLEDAPPGASPGDGTQAESRQTGQPGGSE